MSVRLITAFKGYDEEGNPIRNVSSTDDATLYASVVGPDNYVFASGKRLAGVMEDANTLVVADGDGLVNGHHFIVDGTLSFTIPTGTQGMQVSNIACLRYTKAADGIEDVAPVVLTGESATESPQDPAWNEGSILGGASTVDFPLYRVVTNGVNAGEPECLFETVGPYSSFANLVGTDAAGRIELGGAGGVGGVVRKLLYSGTINAGGSVTIPGLSMYNVILVRPLQPATFGNNSLIPCVRGTVAEFYGLGGNAEHGAGWSIFYTLTLGVSGDTLTFISGYRSGITSTQQTCVAVTQIASIYGLL